jgi:hypothetical protein
MKITGHPTNVRYEAGCAVSTCRQCDWVGPYRNNYMDARADGREHTATPVPPVQPDPHKKWK